MEHVILIKKKRLSVQSKSIKYHRTAAGTAIYKTENCF